MCLEDETHKTKTGQRGNPSSLALLTSEVVKKLSVLFLMWNRFYKNCQQKKLAFTSEGIFWCQIQMTMAGSRFVSQCGNSFMMGFIVAKRKL